MKKIIFTLCIFLSLNAIGQDVHFTQFYSSPLTLNPANTGLVNCDWRLAGNYRNQWSSINSAGYITGTVSYDMSLLKDQLNNGDALGVGVLGLFDRSGTGGSQNTTVGLSIAYHKSLSDDYDRPQTLSIGVQGALVQKSLQPDKLTFESQYDRITGLTLFPSGENINPADPYADFNAGIMYSGQVSDHTSLYGGVSYYHITQPIETFLGDNGNKLNSRVTATLGGSFEMNDNMVIYASGAYQQQGKAYEVIAGGAAGFVLNPYHEDELKSTVFYLGAWYRYNDAVAPYIGFEWSKAKLGFSYDINLSSLTEATQGQGAMEISLIYDGCFISNETKTYNFACPRF